jgi:hypothetical protein
LPPWVAGFRAPETKLVSRLLVLGPDFEDGGPKAVHEIRRKRYKPLLMYWIADPLPVGTVLVRRCGDELDGLLPTRYALADVPYVIRPPCPLAGGSLGLVSGGVVFPKLSKLLHQEDALGAPCLDTAILALRGRPPSRGAPRHAPRHAGHAGTGGMLRTGVIRDFDITLRVATPDIRLTSAHAFAVVVGGGCTGRAHGCKAKQGRRGKDVKTALTCVPSPTVVRFWDGVESGRTILW